MAELFNIKMLSKSILLSLLISVILIGILAAAVFCLSISENTVNGLVFAVPAVSVLTASFILARRIEKGGMLNGLAVSVGFYAVLAMVSLAVNGSVRLGITNLLRLAVTVCSGMLGGVIGINSRNKH